MPDEMFIYANKDKLWLVWDGQPIELGSYAVSAFNWNMGLDSPYVDVSIDIVGQMSNTVQHDKSVDVSDFYDMEECKKLSKIIQRKFDKLLDKEE